MSTIKPGTLCILLDAPEDAWIGRIVEALAAPMERSGYSADGALHTALYVPITGPWMPPPPGDPWDYWMARRDALQPINDPGIDVSKWTHHDRPVRNDLAEHMNGGA